MQRVIGTPVRPQRPVGSRAHVDGDELDVAPRRLAGPGIGLRGTSRLERLAIVGVIVAGLLLAAVSVFRDQFRSADEIVAAAREAEAHPPALDARVRPPWDATLRIVHDGAGTWRREYPSSGTRESFDLWAGERFAFYDADLDVWVETDPGRRRAYLLSIDGADCDGALRLADERIGPWQAYRILCGDVVVWIERSSYLVLREAGTVGGLSYVDEVVELRLDPVLAPGLFRFAPPRGARVLTMAEYRAIAHPPTRPEPPGA